MACNFTMTEEGKNALKNKRGRIHKELFPPQDNLIFPLFSQA